MHYDFHKHILFSTLLIRNVSLSSESAYYYDFWRSCDTEDWSYDAENSNKNPNIWTYIHIENYGSPFPPLNEK